jgi:hypothetical protein
LCEAGFSNYAAIGRKCRDRPNEATGLKIQLSITMPNTKEIYEKVTRPLFVLKIANM